MDGGGTTMTGRTLLILGRLFMVRIIILILRGIWIPIGLWLMVITTGLAEPTMERKRLTGRIFGVVGIGSVAMEQ